MSDHIEPGAAEEEKRIEGRATLPLPAGAARLDVDLLRGRDGASLRVVSSAVDGSVLERREVAFVRDNPLTRPSTGLRAMIQHHRLALTALALYLLVRLIGLAEFPIYFFTDEAVQTVLAADLVRDGFRSYTKELLPTFFQNGGQYNLSISVYLQVIPYILFGKSIWVTRAVCVLVTLLAAWSVWRILAETLHSRYAWVGILVLSALPAWFLHSRTAFETVLACAFYAGFLYFYLRYRCGSPRALFLAVGLGALAFYSYSPMQLVMLVTAVLLLLSDAGYHWQHRRTVLLGFGLALILAVPYLRFMLNHPDENLRHMQIVNSYWTQSLPLGEKLGRFVAGYLRGLDPTYWYLPNPVDFVRHQMKGYGHLMTWMFPLLAIGLVVVLRQVRTSPARVALIALLAAPTGAALANLGVTRALVMVIPVALLTSLGASWLLERLERVWPRPRLIAAGAFVLLAGVNGYMLGDALANGPTWFDQYNLGGMQYGARQVFPAVEQWMLDHPEDQVILSPSWANGTDVIARFFQDPPSFAMGSVEGYIAGRLELDERLVFVMIPQELEQAAQSGKFDRIQIEKILPYPDGRPGFIFTRLKYMDQIDLLMERERQERRALGEVELNWNEDPVQVRFSTLDMGQIKDAFDNDDQSLLRTLEANPLVIAVDYTQARAIQELRARVGGTSSRVTVYFYEHNQERAMTLSQSVAEAPQPRDVIFRLPRTVNITRLVVEVFSVNDLEPAHVHLWEIQVK